MKRALASVGTCCPQHAPGTSRQPDTRSGLSRAQRRLLRCMPARFSTEAHCAFSPPIISMPLSDCNVQYRIDSLILSQQMFTERSQHLGRWEEGVTWSFRLSRCQHRNISQRYKTIGRTCKLASSFTLSVCVARGRHPRLPT